ncbi:MAG: hypothetical protein ACLRMZ_27415 [Blautia marasmi]
MRIPIYRCSETASERTERCDQGFFTDSGWHEDSSGRWYQNADGTYYTNGSAEIDGVKYAFDSNGYMQTGCDQGVNDYYFNEDGS